MLDPRDYLVKLPPWPHADDAIPFRARTVTLPSGEQIAHYDEGSGPVVLMIHGNPTSKDLWRHLIGPVSRSHRVLAPDLMGSQRQARHPDPLTREGDTLLAFVDAVAGQDVDVAVVAHDWGVAVAADLVRRAPGRIRAVAFCEGLLYPVTLADYDFVTWFLARVLQVPVLSRLLLIELNLFLRVFMPLGCRRRMTPASRARYAARYPDRGAREQIWRWVQTVPGHAGHPYHSRLIASREALLSSTIPKLFFFGHPGFSMSPRTTADVRARGKNVDACDLGAGVHYFMEDEPDLMLAQLLPWLKRVVS